MAEKRTIELEIQDNSKTLKQQYKEAVKELQNVAAAYGETSQQAVEAAKKAAGLKDQIEDTNDLLQSYKGEGAFIAMGKAMSAVASGFSAVEGGLGLLGVESEKLQETMLRVQSAMALAQGLEGLEDAGRAFKNLGTVAMNALKGIKGALAATGIGLFVVALGTVVAYWDEIKEAVSGVSAEQAKLNEETHKNFETSKEQLSTLDAQDNVLKLQGKSERQILNIKIAQINATIEKGKIELENVLKTSKAEEAAAIQNYNMTKKIVDFTLEAALFLPKLMLKPIDLAIQGANKVSEILGFGKAISFDVGKTIEGLQDKASDFIAGSIFNVPELKKENEETAKEIRKSIADLENQKAGFQLSIKEMDKQAAVDVKKAADDARTAEEQAQKDFEERMKNENTLRTKSVLESSNYRLEKQKQEAALSKEIDKTRLDAYSQYLEEVKKKDEEEAARKKKQQDSSIELALSGLSAISSITELFGRKGEKQAKRAFQINKAAQVAQATINTYQSATGAYASQMALATPDAPIRAAVAAGIAVASGLANVAKIASQKFEGGSQGGGSAIAGGGGGGAQMAAPQFNTIGSSGINQLATLQQQPVQAYVVSGEVTSAQSLDRNRVQNATL
jgi:hypothetical protein